MLKPKNDLLQGTLALLVLKTLARGPLHGYGITLHIQMVSTIPCASKKAPSIPRSTAWSRSAGSAPNGACPENNRRARYYQ